MELNPFKLLTLGYSVVPSGGGPSGKSPIVKWTDYQTKKPSESDIEQWASQLTPNLWGIITGAISGVAIVDIDKPEYKSIFDKANLKPHIQTPRGGFHYWFKYPGYHVKTVAGIMPGIDIRGDGGFVNVIGKRPDGEYKTLEVPLPDQLYDWDRLPVEIKALLNRHVKKAIIDKLGVKVKLGGRNDYLARRAGLLRQKNFSQDAIEAALLRDNAEKCDPPLEDDEVIRIAASISKYEAKKEKLPATWRDEIVKHHDLLAKPLPEIDYLVDRFIPYPGLVAIAGKKKIGKSFLMLQLAQCIASGTNFLDMPVRAGGVLYMALEDGDQRIKQRLLMQNTQNQLDIFYIHKIPALNTQQGLNTFIEMLSEIKPDLVIIDTIKAAVNGKLDENEAGFTAQLFNNLHDMTLKYNTTIVFVAHHGKGKFGVQPEARDPGFDIRGTSAIPGATDCNISVYKNSDGTFDLLSESRDAAEKELRVFFDKELTWTWINKGDAKDARRLDAENRIIDTICDLGGNVDATQIANELGVTRQAVQIEIKNMREAGILSYTRKGRSVYYDINKGKENK